MSNEEGYIKFQCDWDQSQAVTPKEIENLLNIRNELYQSNYIGAYDNGVGFGNISQRMGTGNQFIISGSKTGNYRSIGPEHFAKVLACDLEKNLVKCQGMTIASSESMAHYAIYAANRNINGVIHIHHMEAWKKYRDKLPTTGPDAAFGTPEISREIQEILIQHPMKKIIIMGGHKEGIIAYGHDLKQAFRELEHILSPFK